MADQGHFSFMELKSQILQHVRTLYNTLDPEPDSDREVEVYLKLIRSAPNPEQYVAIVVSNQYIPTRIVRVLIEVSMSK